MRCCGAWGQFNRTGTAQAPDGAPLGEGNGGKNDKRGPRRVTRHGGLDPYGNGLGRRSVCHVHASIEVEMTNRRLGSLARRFAAGSLPATRPTKRRLSFDDVNGDQQCVPSRRGITSHGAAKNVPSPGNKNAVRTFGAVGLPAAELVRMTNHPSGQFPGATRSVARTCRGRNRRERW
jgi:hypothetical protein